MSRPHDGEAGCENGDDDPPAWMGKPRGRGRLDVFLGAAPGVGKTYAMLAEAEHRVVEGESVTVGLVLTHDRPDTEAKLRSLEMLPPRLVTYGGGQFEEVDVDGLLELRPDVAVIDELAHRCVPGSRHEKRWEDVEELLDEGIDVITSLNVQHIESLNAPVESATGMHQEETVPDAVVAAADRVTFIDIIPERLRERISHGEILTGNTTTALSGFYSTEHVAVLRRLGKGWLAARGLLDEAETTASMEPATKEGAPVVVALTGAPEAEHVLRRAAQIAASGGGRLIGIYVRVPSDTVESAPPWLSGQRRLLAELGGRYTEQTGIDVATVVVEFARSEGAGQLVLGSTRRSRRDEFLHGSVINKAIRSAGPIEVHVIPPRHPGERAPLPAPPVHPRQRISLPLRRRQAAWVAAIVAPLAVTLALVPVRSSLQLSGVLLCNLLLVVGVALLGGIRPAVLSTAVAFLVSDFFYAPPFYSLRVGRLVDLIALITFVVVAAAVGGLVDVLTRQGVRVARASAQGGNLARLVADFVAGRNDAAEMVGSLQRTFELDGVALLSRHDAGWRVEAAAGETRISSPGEAELAVEIAPGQVLALAGQPLDDREAILLRTFVDEVRYAREQAILHALDSTS